MSTPRPIPCPDCDYDLRGIISLRGATCPECGKTWSGRELSRDADLSSRLWLPTVFVTPIINLAAGVATLLVFSILPGPRLAASMTAGYAAAYVWCFRAERHRQAAPFGPDSGSCERDTDLTNAALMAALISLIASAPAAVTLWCINSLL